MIEFKNKGMGMEFAKTLSSNPTHLYPLE